MFMMSIRYRGRCGGSPFARHANSVEGIKLETNIIEYAYASHMYICMAQAWRVA